MRCAFHAYCAVDARRQRLCVCPRRVKCALSGLDSEAGREREGEIEREGALCRLPCGSQSCKLLKRTSPWRVQFDLHLRCDATRRAEAARNALITFASGASIEWRVPPRQELCNLIAGAGAGGGVGGGWVG